MKLTSKTWIYELILISFFLLLMTNCKKEENNNSDAATKIAGIYNGTLKLDTSPIGTVATTITRSSETTVILSVPIGDNILTIDSINVVTTDGLEYTLSYTGSKAIDGFGGIASSKFLNWGFWLPAGPLTFNGSR